MNNLSISTQLFCDDIDLNGYVYSSDTIQCEIDKVKTRIENIEDQMDDDNIDILFNERNELIQNYLEEQQRLNYLNLLKETYDFDSEKS